MKKTVLKFGLISGAIIAGLMLATIPFMHQIGFDYGMVVGYTSMLLAFLLVFFGIRSYRDNVSNGHITFKRAFAVGILITLISSLCYVITWEIVYFNVMPDFADKYSNHVVEKMRNSGASTEQISQQSEKMKELKVMLDNPLYNGLMTFTEPFPVGLLVTTISALILRRKPKDLDVKEQLASGEAGPVTL
jgi:Protein of unknown function (DUF4199)